MFPTLPQVNCYDLADETEVKTEGALRAKFDQAAHCAPSVLLLRNIDALARADQKLETGKGTNGSSCKEGKPLTR